MTTTAPPDRLALPRTRSFHRARPQRLWWIALLIAVVANLGLVLALSQVSQLQLTAPEPPLAVHSLHLIPHEVPPPPPPDEPREAAVEHLPEAVPVALPTLDLPAAPTASALSLPALGTLDADLSLPISVPAFAAIGEPRDPAAPSAAPASGTPAFDSPAQREGAFDLELYYPRTARLRGITGSTRLRMAIDATGRVANAEILESTPPGVFELAADRLARSLHFRPAQSAGTPIASVQDLTIAWTMK